METKLSAEEISKNKLLNKNTKEYSNKVLLFIKDYFGTTTELYYGPTFILPNGEFLNMKNCKHHAEAEHVLIDAGLSDCPRLDTNGSPTLSAIGCIRCDFVKYYLQLPNSSITDEQKNSLLLWLDLLATFTKLVYVVSPTGDQEVLYRFSETIPDEIIDRIHRYYISGILYEYLNQKHSRGFRYDRKQVGCGLSYTDRFQESLNKTKDKDASFNSIYKELSNINKR